MVGSKTAAKMAKSQRKVVSTAFRISSVLGAFMVGAVLYALIPPAKYALPGSEAMMYVVSRALARPLHNVSTVKSQLAQNIRHCKYIYRYLKLFLALFLWEEDGHQFTPGLNTHHLRPSLI